MKIIFSIIITLLIVSTSIASTAKVQKIKLLQGTTIGSYAKPGAPVDISYTSEHVDTGDTSEIKIVLSTSVQTGTMKALVNVDKALEEISYLEKEIVFNLETNKKEYPINLNVLGRSEGSYYIRILVEIKGRGMRAFAVPVHIGNPKANIQSKPSIKSANGSKLNVSNALETIK